MNQDIYEQLARMDRRIRVIGRVVMTAEMIGAGWLTYAACQRYGLSEGWSIGIAIIFGLMIGRGTEREFYR